MKGALLVVTYQTNTQHNSLRTILTSDIICWKRKQPMVSRNGQYAKGCQRLAKDDSDSSDGSDVYIFRNFCKCISSLSLSVVGKDFD